MGQSCSNSKTQIKPVSLNDLQNTGINEVYVSQNGCLPNITGPQAGGALSTALNNGFSFPNNNEFEWGYNFNNNCSMCTTCYSQECEGGITGIRPTVKRIAYNGDINNCCINQTKLDGDKTCDSKYLSYNNDSCNNTMKVYCSNGDNINNDKCKQWAAEQPTAAISVLENWCAKGDNIKNSQCLDYTKKNPSYGDVIVSNYCKNNPNDTSFCGCYNLSQYDNIIKTFSNKGITLLPECNLPTCSSNPDAYKPSNFNKTCPEQNICSSDIIQNNNTGTIKLDNINFSCNINNTPTSTTQELSQPNNTSTTQSQSQSQIQTNYINNLQIMIIIIIIIIVLIISGIIIKKLVIK